MGEARRQTFRLPHEGSSKGKELDLAPCDANACPMKRKITNGYSCSIVKERTSRPLDEGKRL